MVRRGRGAHPRTGSAQDISIQRRRAFVLELVDREATWQEIAERVLAEGLAPVPAWRDPAKPRPEPRYTRADAYNDAQRAMRAITEKPAAERKAMQNRRLAKQQRILARDASNPLLSPLDRARAVSVMVRLMVREAKLNGLDEPTRTSLEITQHFEQLASLSTGAMTAGFDALGLDAGQRKVAIEAMQTYLLAVEAGAPGGQRALPGEIYDAELVDDEQDAG
jgi:hypothetical protein